MLQAPDSEIMIGLVAPVGADLDAVVHILEDRFSHFGYSSKIIRLSALISQMDGLETVLRNDTYSDYLHSYMDAGNEARRKFSRGDFLALSAIYQIYQERQGESKPLGQVAHILRSLKHPDEVATLRQVYGSGFFVLGIHAPKQTRIDYLTQDKNIPLEKAEEILERDEAEYNDLGQRTRDTFELCDAFVALHRQDFKDQIWRILDLLFGDPYQTPTRDEYAMFLSYGVSLRSADLSRQVGSVILSDTGEIIATGANDVPCFGGGLYWSGDENDQRDYQRGYDSNAKRRNDILINIMQQIEPNIDKTPDDLIERGKQLFGETGLLDITEFGRVVHAEMEALLSCARMGVSPMRATLYSTTFPCHNCAKHIVAAGIKRVVFVEPYPKSQALQLHDDAIEFEPASRSSNKVSFEPFVGVGPRRFMDLFSLRMSSGHRIIRNQNGNKIEWSREKAQLRVPMLPTSYLDREVLLVSELNAAMEETNVYTKETE